MLIGGIVAAVAVAVLATALLTRRAAHDDVHSVEGYHRSLHTLETINAHPTVAGEGSDTDHRGERDHPADAVRIAGSSTVRLTDSGRPTVPPIPPPPLADPDVLLTFDDEAHDHDVDRPSRLHASSQSSPPSAPPELRGKAMVSINRRPRRLAAPATAVAAVLILVVVLLVTGTHSPTPHTHGPGATRGAAGPSPSTADGKTKTKTKTKTTSTTQPPAVSAPVSASAGAATYQVGASTFSMTLAATSGACWVDATDSTTGATLFTGTLGPGERQTFTATSPVTIVVGAPTVFVASVNGEAAVLPTGFRTPFTMSFVTSGAPAS
jgi:hypothetical protein